MPTAGGRHRPALFDMVAAGVRSDGRAGHDGGVLARTIATATTNSPGSGAGNQRCTLDLARLRRAARRRTDHSPGLALQPSERGRHDRHLHGQRLDGRAVR